MNICQNCEVTFKALPATKGKYHNKECYWKSLKNIPPPFIDNHGHIPWNKGKHPEYMQGKNHWAYGKKRSDITGKNHFKWKGDNVGIGGIHMWIRKIKGNPMKCTKCDSNKRIEWSNISYLYKRDINDWEALCHKCHMIKDHKLNWDARKNIFNNKGQRII